MSNDVGFKTFLKLNLTRQMLLAPQVRFDGNMVARLVTPLAPGYWTALSSRSAPCNDMSICHTVFTRV